MFKYMRSAYLPAIALAISLAACGDKKETAEDALNRDLEMAAADSAAQPSLQDVAPTPEPAPAPAAKPAPRPTAPKPAPKPTTTAGNKATSSSGESAMGTISAGTSLSLTSNARVCTNTNKVGDKVTASVAQTVSGSNGVVIPAGSPVTLEITQLKRSENVNDKIVMGFVVRSVSVNGRSYNMPATVTYAQVENVKEEAKGKNAKKVVTGAAAGAILGQVLGKDAKGTIIGAAAGAAAGAAGAAATANTEGCVPQGGSFTVSLSDAVQIHR